MSTSLQIKQIHTLKNILGLDDDLYREMLASFGVYSSKKLTETEANILIEILQDKTKKLKLAKPKKYDDLSERDSKMSTPLQLRKIEAIWWDICNTAESVQQIRSLIFFSLYLLLTVITIFYNFKELLKELKRIENIIITIGELDDSSFTFRYLTDKEGGYIFSNNEMINIENIADKVQDVKTFFEHLKCGFDMLEEVRQIYLKDIGQVY